MCNKYAHQVLNFCNCQMICSEYGIACDNNLGTKFNYHIYTRYYNTYPYLYIISEVTDYNLYSSIACFVFHSNSLQFSCSKK